MQGVFATLIKSFKAKPDEPCFIRVDERSVPVSFRKNARAKRIVLRLDRKTEGIVVTLPGRASRARAMAFVETSLPWIATQLTRRKLAGPVTAGGRISLRGIPHEVRSTGMLRGVARLDMEEKVVHVPGDAAHLSRRLTDWLKALAKADLTEASERYARLMNVRLGHITVRDQKTRWGSCSASGDLSYSWRLILAPHYVLDYVAAHEVAHRVEMNHGPKFWRLVLTHCAHAGDAKRWFKEHGADLHRQGL